jgi:hypothetical protein
MTTGRYNVLSWEGTHANGQKFTEVNLERQDEELWV